MRTGNTENARSFVVLKVQDAEAEWESLPPTPFGAVVVAPAEKPLKEIFSKVAQRLLETGCGWATLHAGKFTRHLHDIFDRAVVDYQLEHSPDVEMMTSGEDEDSLEDAMRDAVHFGFPTYGERYPGLLVLVVAPEDSKLDEQAEALAKSVKPE
jgi:hypothetical protein